MLVEEVNEIAKGHRAEYWVAGASAGRWLFDPSNRANALVKVRLWLRQDLLKSTSQEHRFNQARGSCSEPVFHSRLCRLTQGLGCLEATASLPNAGPVRESIDWLWSFFQSEGLR